MGSKPSPAVNLSLEDWARGTRSIGEYEDEDMEVSINRNIEIRTMPFFQ